jgi:hypothetical protein
MQVWMHGGSREVVEFVKARADQWQWWDNEQIARPMVSMVVVRAEDAFEAGRPAEGAVLRVRCAWQNTAQGLPKQALAELVRLEVDGKVVETKQTMLRNARGAVRDVYRVAPVEKGRHRAKATVWVNGSGKEIVRLMEFEM